MICSPYSQNIAMFLSNFQLTQVILEERITKTSTKLDLPVGREALLTQKDGRTRFIFASDEQQIFRENKPDLKILYARPFLLFDTTLRKTVFIHS